MAITFDMVLTFFVAASTVAINFISSSPPGRNEPKNPFKTLYFSDKSYSNDRNRLVVREVGAAKQFAGNYFR